MFRGVITPVITVLDKQGKLDLEGNRLVINRLIDSGVNGLLFFGSIGEFFALNMEEKREFIRFAVQTVNKRVPVLIGVGATIQEESIELTHIAEQAGADGVIAVSPYYFNLNSETLYRYYANLALSTSMPIMIYNFPDRTAVNLEPELVLKLAKEFKHIVAIKDTVDNISHTRSLIQVVKAERPNFKVFGYDEYLVPNLMAGGDGVIGGMSNVAPDIFVGLLRDYKNKNFDGVVAAQGVSIGAYVKEPSAELDDQQIGKIKA